MNQLSIIDFPSLYGRAGAELYHQIPVWEKLGVKFHFIPTQKSARGAALYHEMIGATTSSTKRTTGTPSPKTRTPSAFAMKTSSPPSRKSATRPLSIRKNATWYTYGHDLTKNVTELYNAAGGIATAYDYSPYGEVTAAGPDQPLQWSSEVYDAELGMVYYNSRHYNPMDGRWIGRDLLGELNSSRKSINLYTFVYNITASYYDYLGNPPYSGVPPVYNPSLWNDNGRYQHANNCYSYACDTRYDGDKVDPSKRDPRGYYKPQPGEPSGYDPQRVTITCDAIIKRAEGYGLYKLDPSEKCCKKNYHKVALVVESKGIDYHWYRQDQGGDWSHKPGEDPVQNTDDSGNMITNPETADRGMYDKFCSYMCAPDA